MKQETFLDSEGKGTHTLFRRLEAKKTLCRKWKSSRWKSFSVECIFLDAFLYMLFDTMIALVLGTIFGHFLVVKDFLIACQFKAHLYSKAYYIKQV